MLLSSPIPRAAQPRFNEGSSLRSIRDTDATSRQWIKNDDTSFQAWAVLGVVARLSRTVDQLRRRILGGSGRGTSSGFFYAGVWNSGKSYPAQNQVTFTPQGQSAGEYISIIPVPAGISPDTGAPYWHANATPTPGNWG